MVISCFRLMYALWVLDWLSVWGQDDRYVGCFIDDSGDRALPVEAGPGGNWFNDNTPDNCFKRCFSHRPNHMYTYAGVQFGYMCFCGYDDYDRHGGVDDSECQDESRRCPGDRSLYCGAGSRNAVYRAECRLGKFRPPDCAGECHCRHDDWCDRETGNCTGNCEAGWTEWNCQTSCGKGTFGPGCTGVCHCKATCDHRNGWCTDRKCAPGWKGPPACQTECVNMFGDDCLGTCHCAGSCDKETGDCDDKGCAAGWTNYGDDRNCQKECGGNQFGANCAGACHCAGSCDVETGNCDGHGCADGWENHAGQHNCQKSCSIKGKFGQGCGMYCHCESGATCNNVNGSCGGSVCAPGWRDHPRCQTECGLSNFGSNCLGECHCLDNSHCRKTDGSCQGQPCEAGWMSELSKRDDCQIVLVCTTGQFGPGCTGECHCLDNSYCSNTDGSCQGQPCEAGWMSAQGREDCQIGCSYGRFGPGCIGQCHCQQPQDCKKVDGSCPVCEDGWTGWNCQNNCPVGKFNTDCSGECNCNEAGDCDTDGTCRRSGCAEGWSGWNCQEVQKSNSLPLIAGLVTTALISLVLVLVIILLIRRKKNKKEAKPENAIESQEYSEIDENKMYYQGKVDKSTKILKIIKPSSPEVMPYENTSADAQAYEPVSSGQVYENQAFDSTLNTNPDPDYVYEDVQTETQKTHTQARDASQEMTEKSDGKNTNIKESTTNNNGTKYYSEDTTMGTNHDVHNENDRTFSPSDGYTSLKYA